jgi:anti-sigma28 factor (negative regulator of flagellin synthesis)
LYDLRHWQKTAKLIAITTCNPQKQHYHTIIWQRCRKQKQRERREKMKTEIKTELTTITPEMAKVLLATNKNNRRVRASRVREIALDINDGNWKMNGDTIRISKTGVLMDGQHRLQACVLAGISITVITVTGIDDDMFSYMDNGGVRNAADTLQTAGGFKNHSALAAGIRSAYGYEAGEGKTKALSNQRILELARGEFAGMSIMTDTVGSQVGITKNARVSAAAYLISKKAPASKVIEFFNRVRLGESLSRGMPEYTLREWLYNAKRADFSKHHAKRADTISACIIAWNKYAAGKPLRAIRISSRYVEAIRCK